MRIISGDFRGRRLYTPKDKQIRPTTDKVKEAIFNMVAEWIGDGVVADLFAGSGNLGLEALSRGAAKCYFGDNAKESIALIKQNIVYCKAENQSVICPGDYKKVLGKISEKVDVIFLDPPFQKGLMLDCIQTIHGLELLAQDGIIVAEHGADEILPETICAYEKIKEKKYGTIVVTVYQ